eukprot:scaffold58790_cov65-Phaeocystis_antarctica.AAC.12
MAGCEAAGLLQSAHLLVFHAPEHTIVLALLAPAALATPDLDHSLRAAGVALAWLRDLAHQALVLRLDGDHHRLAWKQPAAPVKRSFHSTLSCSSSSSSSYQYSSSSSVSHSFSTWQPWYSFSSCSITLTILLGWGFDAATSPAPPFHSSSSSSSLNCTAPLRAEGLPSGPMTEDSCSSAMVSPSCVAYLCSLSAKLALWKAG